MTVKEHPLYAFLNDVGAGRQPSPKEINEVAREVIDGVAHRNPSLRFEGLHTRLRDEVERIIAYRADGEMGRARKHVKAVGSELAVKFRDFTPPSVEVTETDPGKLAALVAGEAPNDSAEDPANLARQVTEF